MFRFPWGDMHSLNLGWFLQKFNELREDWATAEAGIDGALDAEIQKAEDALSDVFDARDAAAASATAAAGSASSAGTSATAAQNSATAAASSATLANQKATAAGLSEAAAAQSATQAAGSATAAAGSATTASTAATNAAASETAAGQSASAAAASAASVEGDADAAAASATAAAASAARAEEVEESIPADYTALSNDVANIKNAFIPSQNLFDNVLLTGYIGSGGGFVADNGARLTEHYIPVTPGLIYSYTPGRFTQIVEYDSEKTFLNRVTNYNVNQYTPPAGVDFVRLVSWSSTDGLFFGETYMFLQAASMPEYYEPYGLLMPVERVYPYQKTLAYYMPTMRADKPLSRNEIVIVANTLYKITNTIVTGAVITPGTNAEETTLGDLITAILNSI